MTLSPPCFTDGIRLLVDCSVYVILYIQTEKFYFGLVLSYNNAIPSFLVNLHDLEQCKSSYAHFGDLKSIAQIHCSPAGGFINVGISLNT